MKVEIVLKEDCSHNRETCIYYHILISRWYTWFESLISETDARNFMVVRVDVLTPTHIEGVTSNGDAFYAKEIQLSRKEVEPYYIGSNKSLAFALLKAINKEKRDKEKNIVAIDRKKHARATFYDKRDTFLKNKKASQLSEENKTP